MIYFPYDNKSATVQDRNVNSTQFASFIYKLCGYKSGIFETLGNKGVVKSKNGMTVTVEPLDGAIQGRLFDEVAVRELQLDTGGELDRIDTVVVRANYNDRTTDLYISKGVEASLPTRPALKSSGGIHEIGLADIYIPKLTTTITDSRITDTRIDTDRMAILPVINSVDTSAIFNQYQSALDEYLALVETAIDGTTAGHLQNQIGTLADLDTTDKSNLVNAVNEVTTSIIIKTTTILASQAVSDPTYTDYPYRIDEVIPRCDSTYVPTVYPQRIFTDVIFCPIVTSATNSISIWVSNNSFASLNILVQLTKEIGE